MLEERIGKSTSTILGIALVHNPMREQCVLLVNTLTGEILEFDGMWRLSFDAGGLAMLRPVPAGKAFFLSRKLMVQVFENDEGKRYHYSLGTKTVRWFADLSAAYSSRFAPIGISAKGVVRIKIYKKEIPLAGMTVFWQVRDVQDGVWGREREAEAERQRES